MSEHRSLDRAFAGGLAWTAGAKALTQFFSWASVLVVARLLSPAEFGIMDMAGFFIGLTNVLAEFGVGTAVLQMHELDRKALRQLNVASIALCAVAYGAVVLSAPLVAAFFRLEALRLLIVVNGLGLFITGFQAVPMGLVEKDMDYRRLSLAEAVQAFLQAVVTVGCALAGMGYWSFVVGAISAKVTAAALVNSWKPVGFSIPRWTDIAAPLRLGFHVAVTRLTWAAYNQSDAIVVGRTLGDAPLGSYRFALTLAAAPAEKIGLLIMRVTGPLFAKVQKDQDALRRYFKVFSEVLSMSILPLMFGLAAVAPDAVHVLLGPQWNGAIAPLRWLALFIGARTMSALAAQVLTSLRYTRYNMWVSVISFVVMPIGFFVASRWGAGAVAAAWVILSPVTVLPPTLKLLRVLGMPLREYLSVLMPSLIGSAVMLAAVLATRMGILGDDVRPVIRLAVEASVGGVSYAAILLIFYRDRVIRYGRFLMDLRKGDAVLTPSA
jgi:PST family polysaccharide transporter